MGTRSARRVSWKVGRSLRAAVALITTLAVIAGSAPFRFAQAGPEQVEAAETPNFSDDRSGVRAGADDAASAAKKTKARKAPVSATGAFTHSVEIQVPPGRLGMTPSLALSYNRVRPARPERRRGRRRPRGLRGQPRRSAIPCAHALGMAMTLAFAPTCSAPELCVPQEGTVGFFSQGDCALTKRGAFRGHEWITLLGNRDVPDAQRLPDDDIAQVIEGNRRVD